MTLSRRSSFLLGLVCASICGCGGGESPAADLPNVLFITVDTLRADHLGCYGYFRDTTPRIDALAARGVVFERCSVPMATTLPSHVSMLTGAWPIEHGVLSNVAHGGQAFQPSPGLVSVAEVLADCGYRTAAFTSAKPLRADSGVAAGFQHFDESVERERRGDETVGKAEVWLQGHVAQAGDAPFFLWVHLFDPHDPYLPPPGFRRKFSRDDGLDSYLDERRIERDSQGHGRRLTDTRRAHDAYDGEILFTDSLVGRLLDRVSDLGLEDDTVVIFLGDHGEGLGQHGMPGHGYIWGEQLNAPFVLFVPGGEPARVARPVSSIDVFPTLLARLELTCAEVFLAQSSGVDVLAPDFELRPVFGQSTERMAVYGQEQAYVLVRGRWKYLRVGGGPAQLFDLEADPHELRDVAAEEPEFLAQLEHELYGMLAAQKARSEELGKGEAVELDPATLQALRDLGYLGDEEQ